jgi:hypothetical protein
MATYYCVDTGTELAPDPWSPAAKGPHLKHLLLVDAGDELIFWGLNSCLGILFLLSNGQRIGGHVVEIFPIEGGPRGAGVENAEKVLKDMKAMIPGGASVSKLIFVYNARIWGFNNLMALMGSPAYFGIRYGNQCNAKVVGSTILVEEKGKASVTYSTSGVGGIDWEPPKH